MFYHASPVKGITKLEPRISDHHIPLVYFSTKRENTLVYLSNAIEKYCRETGFEYNGIWKKWGPYGFTKDGIQQLQEYYPDALEKTYEGVSGYIYSAESISGSEFVPDAYEAILEAEEKGLISIKRYSEMPEKMLEWIGKTIRQEYEEAMDHPEYRHFLKGNFAEILNV